MPHSNWIGILVLVHIIVNIVSISLNASGELENAPEALNSTNYWYWYSGVSTAVLLVIAFLTQRHRKPMSMISSSSRMPLMPSTPRMPLMSSTPMTPSS